jgi:phosphoserine phosphatase RsbU/P
MNTLQDVFAIQERQSPSAIPRVRGIECFAEHRRGRRPAGDFFNLVDSVPGKLTLSVGTLPMKGIAGPILMNGLLATLRSLGTHGPDLSEMLGELNRIMWNITPERTFASLFCARVTPGSGRLHYVNAGHEAALVWRPRGGVERLEPHAAVLGLSRHSQFHQRSVRFQHGDTLLALTEGSEAGADMVLRAKTGVRLRDLPGRIIESAEGLPGFQNPDRTVVVVRCE